MRRLIPIAIMLASVSTLAFVNWKMALSPVETARILAETQLKDFPPTNVTDKSLEFPIISMLQASQRPLFSPDRRPWTPPPLEPPAATVEQLSPDVQVAPPSPPPFVMLLGIQKSPNGATVLLAAEAGSTPIWLKEGESYKSWHVRNINPASVDLAYGDSKLTLELYPTSQMGQLVP